MVKLTDDERNALMNCRKLAENSEVPFPEYWDACEFHSVLGPRHLSVDEHFRNLGACLVAIEETPSAIAAEELTGLVNLLDSGKSVVIVAPVRAVRDHIKAQIMACAAPPAGSC